MTDPTADGRAAASATPRSPASRSWPAGWAAPTSRPARRSSTRPGIPTFPYPDTAARAFTLMWRYSLQPPRPLRNPDPARRRRTDRSRPRRGPRRSIAAAAAAGRTLLDRVRVEAAARRLRHSDRRDPRRRRPRTRPSRRPTRSAIPVVLKLHLARRSRTRPTSAACNSIWPTPKPSAGAFRAIEIRGARAGRRRAFPGRDRAADGPARRLRADPRQQPRPAVRPGAAVRHRRPARRGLQGPRAGAAAAEHHAGAADDGADADLHGAARACADASRSTSRRSSSSWCGSASWSSSSRWIKEIDINPLLASPERLAGARRARGRARAGDRARTDCRGRRSAPIRRSTSPPGPHATAPRSLLRPIRPGGRAAAGRTSTRRSPSGASTSAISTR